jgi:hypothetical protein
MAAGEAQLTEAQLTDLLSGVVTGPGADQDGLTQSARTRAARTRPADPTTAVLARRIPGAEYRVVAGAGHMVNMEQPAAVNALLTRFLAGLPAPATERLSEQAEELTGRGDEQWSR